MYINGHEKDSDVLSK